MGGASARLPGRRRQHSTRPDLAGHVGAGRSKTIITRSSLNVNPTQPGDHRPTLLAAL